MGETAGKLIVSWTQAVGGSASYTRDDRNPSYPQKYRKLLSRELTELHTQMLIIIKNLFKTVIYGVNLYFFVDNLCKCVEKHENKLV